jgi:hypothetical protein
MAMESGVTRSPSLPAFYTEVTMIPLETVTVEHPDTPGAKMIINKTDFDPAIHKLYEPPTEEQPSADAEPPKPKGRAKKTEE